MKYFITLLIVLIFFSCSAIEKETTNKQLKGFYSYMADAGIFIHCETNIKYPVAMEADNIALERAYLKIVEKPMEKIIVTLTGHFEKRPKIEGVGEQEFLIVEKFEKIWPNIDCVRNLGTATLQNTFWALRNLNGKSLKEYNFERNLNLMLKTDGSIKGFSGCNNFFGNYTIFNDTLKLSQIGTTRKMCENMDIENEFLKMFENIISYKIYGEYLYFYNKNGVIAKFESVYFN